MVNDERDKVRQDGEEVNQVHGVDEEPELPGAAGEPDHILDGEVDRREGVHPDNGRDDAAGGAGLFCLVLGRRGRCGRRRVL